MRILFIVNPVSGMGWGRELPGKLRSMPEYRDVAYDIEYTQYAGHGRELVEAARESGNHTHIVAVGGDGTVNEVGTALFGSDIAFSVVSLGSGNGFARHLGYSQFVRKALRQLLTGISVHVDVLEINGLYSLNVSGVGFDAEIAHEFNTLKIRGVLSYVYAGTKRWFRYSEKRYKITFDGKSIEEDCFILSFANASQYGNNVSIAPHASLTDGLVDICLLKRPTFWSVHSFLFYMLNRRLDKFKYFKELQCREAVIEGDIHKVHIDGEAVIMHSPIHLKVHRKALKVVLPTHI